MATGTALNFIATDKDEMKRDIRAQLVAKLGNKAYRDVFVSEQINTGLAFQIRALRSQRDWSQAELGTRAEMAQSRISVMEDANYARFSLNTLKRLASAFDVGLVVRFAPFSELVGNFENLSPHSLEAAPFSEDKFFQTAQLTSASTPTGFKKIAAHSNPTPQLDIVVTEDTAPWWIPGGTQSATNQIQQFV
jgi:transcriptional regulator with XRE-family HTH domain